MMQKLHNEAVEGLAKVKQGKLEMEAHGNDSIYLPPPGSPMTMDAFETTNLGMLLDNLQTQQEDLAREMALEMPDTNTETISLTEATRGICTMLKAEPYCALTLYVSHVQYIEFFSIPNSMIILGYFYRMRVFLFCSIIRKFRGSMTDMSTAKSPHVTS